MRGRFIGAAAVCIALVFGTNAAAYSRPAPGQIIGQIIIPKIHEASAYVEGNGDDAAIPGVLPVHYRSTNLPGEGQTIVISGHHFTHPAPGASGGVFLHLDQVVPGDSIYLTRAARFGGGTYRFIVASNRSVFCGRTAVGFYDCPPAVHLMRDFQQTKVYVITCIGDGYERRVVTAFAAKGQT